jgi:hypothetical protein
MVVNEEFVQKLVELYKVKGQLKALNASKSELSLQIASKQEELAAAEEALFAAAK